MNINNCVDFPALLVNCLIVNGGIHLSRYYRDLYFLDKQLERLELDCQKLIILLLR